MEKSQPILISKPLQYHCNDWLILLRSVFKGITRYCNAIAIIYGGNCNFIAINATHFSTPICPVYQNVTANAVTNPDEIKKNLLVQLTAPVRWTQTMEKMIADGATSFIEVGPGKVLQGLVKKVNKDMEALSA